MFTNLIVFSFVSYVVHTLDLECPTYHKIYRGQFFLFLLRCEVLNPMFFTQRNLHVYIK